MKLPDALTNYQNIIKPMPIPDIDVRNYNLADYQYELLCNHIKNFQDTLDDEHEVGVQLASFGQSIILNVEKIGYSNPCRNIK